VQPWRELAREEQRLVGQRIELNRLLARKRVAGGENDNNLLAADRVVGEVVDDLRIEGDCDVDHSGAQRNRHLLRAHLLRDELDVWLSTLKRLSQRRQSLEAGAPVVGDAENAELSGRHALRGIDGGSRFGESASRAVEQCFARLGQLDLAACTHEQARADLLLELPDCDAERRLRHA
jgi:hypothetical protein